MNNTDQTEVTKNYIPDNYKVKCEGNIYLFNVPADKITEICSELYHKNNLQLKTITVIDDTNDTGGFRIIYLFGVPFDNIFIAPFIELKNTDNFPSVTNIIHEASGYERKINTFFGLTPLGHPDLRQLIIHDNWPKNLYPLRKKFLWKKRPRVAHNKYEFHKVIGEGIYEIPVGPVHAGIIEPGHFRFSMAGEEIVLLEPRLGYKHKGTEKLFEILPLDMKIKLSERVSGDTSFTHSLAFCQALESLSQIQIPDRAKYLRVIFSELERLANHINDIGFIMLDTGYSFGGYSGQRLRETIMQLNEYLTGSRFLRGVNTAGGVTVDIDELKSEYLRNQLSIFQKDFDEVIEISEGSSSLLHRLTGAGKLNRQLALDHGVVGVAGRAVNIARDARLEYPYAGYNQIKFNIALEKEGDVWARWHTRIKEVHSSLEIIKQALKSLPKNRMIKSNEKIIFNNNSLAVGITEGWRGEIVYLLATDTKGDISRVDIRDPSFLNWTVLGPTGHGNPLPDFPLINKSFNLSYSGYDL